MQVDPHPLIHKTQPPETMTAGVGSHNSGTGSH